MDQFIMGTELPQMNNFRNSNIDTHSDHSMNRMNYDNNSSYSNYSNSSSKKSRIYNTNPNISKLISDINKDLVEYAPSNSKDNDDTEDEDYNDTNNEGMLSKIPYWIKEITLFVIIYFIFSMGFFKKTVGSYIKYINPDEDGNISFIGVIIYGILLVTTFMVARYFLI